MQHITGQMRAAIQRYNMIEDGDKIAVGVSGGKDSLVLLYGLSLLKEYFEKKFDIVALTCDSGFLNQEGDFSSISRFCKENGIDYEIKRTRLYSVVFEYRREKNPCALCAKMRRGILHDMAKEHGCNKIALGHHSDDVVETFLMNLLDGGNLACFSPVTYLSRKDITLIRPLIFCDEKEIAKTAEKYSLPVCKSSCPIDKTTNRQRTKELISSLEQHTPDVKQKVQTAIKTAHLSDW